MHRHRSRRPRLPRPALLIALFALAASTTVADATRRHTRLVRSVPPRDSVVRALPPRLQLWFSEAIELEVSRVRLVGPEARSHVLAPLARDGAANTAPVTAPFPQGLADGRYVVHWSTASRDGHVVRDSFAFTLRGR
jgi:methionine-rich copper-binding protein CopC